jgi:hypothetical protein
MSSFRDIAELAYFLLIIVIGIAEGISMYFSSGILWGVGVALAIIFLGALFGYILFEELIPE